MIDRRQEEKPSNFRLPICDLRFGKSEIGTPSTSLPSTLLWAGRTGRQLEITGFMAVIASALRMGIFHEPVWERGTLGRSNVRHA